jgi:hypothetical protein
VGDQLVACQLVSTWAAYARSSYRSESRSRFVMVL